MICTLYNVQYTSTVHAYHGSVHVNQKCIDYCFKQKTFLILPLIMRLSFEANDEQILNQESKPEKLPKPWAGAAKERTGSATLTLRLLQLRRNYMCLFVCILCCNIHNPQVCPCTTPGGRMRWCCSVLLPTILSAQPSWWTWYSTLTSVDTSGKPCSFEAGIFYWKE